MVSSSCSSSFSPRPNELLVGVFLLEVLLELGFHLGFLELLDQLIVEFLDFGVGLVVEFGNLF